MRFARPSANFHRAKNVSIAALTLSLLMWLVAFLSIGAEWFLMWQSKTWNGQEAAFRMFTVVALILSSSSNPTPSSPRDAFVWGAAASDLATASAV